MKAESQLRLQVYTICTCVSCSRFRVSASDGGQVRYERRGELKDLVDVYTNLPR